MNTVLVVLIVCVFVYIVTGALCFWLFPYVRKDVVFWDIARESKRIRKQEEENNPKTDGNGNA